MYNFIDLTGQRFGRLTVVKRVEDYILPSGQHKPQWLCKCDCGNETIVLGELLRYHHTQSCGCLHSEITSIIKKKYNRYDLSGEYGIGYDCKDKMFLFDLEDYNKIKDYCWAINTNGYVVTHDNNNKGKMLLMHRLIMDCDNNGLYVDHIHGEQSKYDNRKSNLRIVTPYQNSLNRAKLKNNTSGTTGVSWNKRKNKWESYIGVNGKRIKLGYFDSFDDAVAARKQAEEKYFGEYSYDNSQAS